MKRSIAIGVLAASLLALASPASAGGNWIEFRRAEGAAASDDPSGGSPVRDARSRWDIFATGESVVARVGYLSRTFGADDGPFHLWIERGDELQAGEPIPATALRVGTFDMSPDGRGGVVRFVLPDLPRGMHTFVVCDDPCTTYGFDESVQGWLTSVPTAGEGQLLARVRELRWDERELVASLRGEVRAGERQEELLGLQVTELEQQLETARGQLARLAAERPAPPAPRSDALIDGAGGAWIASAMLAIAAVWLIARRRRRIIVPDTPAELMPLEPEATRVRSERVLEDLDV
jgi:hypothetical protein